MQKIKGEIESNRVKYGNGFDVYINIDSKESLNEFYMQCKSLNIDIEEEPRMTDYGSLEFVFKDIDGRNIGVGLILNHSNFFENSNYIHSSS